MTKLFASDPVFLQRFLRAGGYYKHDIDGLVGTQTESAVARFVADGVNVASQLGVFDKRTEGSLASVLIPTQRMARKFLAACATAGLQSGYTVRVISGSRTFAEQDELFAQGRTKPGKKVTNARGGQSNHNFGIAWDVGIFTQKGEYIDALADKGKLSIDHVEGQYKKLGPVGRALGLHWGGDWSKPDRPHYQLLDNDHLASVRDRFLTGSGAIP